MKKRFLYLFLLPFLLASCGEPTVSLDVMREKVNEVDDAPLYPIYKVIYAIDFNNMEDSNEATFDQTPEPEKFVPYSRYNDGFYHPDLDNSEDEENVVIYSMASHSYWLRAPLRISKSNFYVIDEDGTENTTCAHYLIEHIITSYYGIPGTVNPSKNRMQMSINQDGDFIFFANGVHTKVNIDNVPYYPDYSAHPELGDEWNYDSPLPCYLNVVNAKVNISFRYNKDGWLVEEKMESVGYDYNVSTPAQVSLRSVYGYLFG